MFRVLGLSFFVAFLAAVYVVLVSRHADLAIAGRRIYDVADKGDVAALIPLLAQRIDKHVLNWSNSDLMGWTPLIISAAKGNWEVVKALLAAPGIDINKANHKGRTAITMAAFDDHIEVVRALLAAPGIDINKADTEYGMTAIMCAGSFGYIEVVRALLAAPGIDVNKADKDGWTALLWASQKRHHEVVRALLAAPGIVVNQVSVQGSGSNKTDIQTRS